MEETSERRWQVGLEAGKDSEEETATAAAEDPKCFCIEKRRWESARVKEGLHLLLMAGEGLGF